jgi:hypothetical protein
LDYRPLVDQRYRDLQRLESKGVGFVSFREQWLYSRGPFQDVMVLMFATWQSRKPQGYREQRPD